MKSENNIEINDELIVRYLVGEARPEEAMALDDWLVDPGNRSHFEKLKITWHAIHPRKKRRTITRDAAWAKLQQTLEAQPVVRSGSALRLAYRIAASVTALILAGAGIYYWLDKNTNDIRVATSTSVKHVSFSDRSAAILYRHTDLSYPDNFGKGRREVKLLQGEAFFDITPDRARPFIIHTPTADIRVVGTSFNVVVGKDQTEVGVLEGKVMVITEKDTVHLEAGSAGLVRMGTIRIKDSVNANDWGYATQHFIFKDTPLADVVASFQKAFPYALQLKDSTINNCKLTATFDKVSAEKMLDLIAETLNLSVTRNDTVFILEGPGCP